jgi:hypothetical protein
MFQRRGENLLAELRQRSYADQFLYSVGDFQFSRLAGVRIMFTFRADSSRYSGSPYS